MMETLNFNEWLPDSFEQIISELISDKVDESYHSHDFYEIFYITQGYAYHIFNGEKEKLEVGDMFLIRPGDYHMFVRGEGESCTHRDILLNKKLFE